MNRGVKLQNSDKSIYIIDDNKIFHSEEEYLKYEKLQRKQVKKNRIVLFIAFLIMISCFYFEVKNLNKDYSITSSGDTLKDYIK